MALSPDEPSCSASSEPSLSTCEDPVPPSPTHWNSLWLFFQYELSTELHCLSLVFPSSKMLCVYLQAHQIRVPHMAESVP